VKAGFAVLAALAAVWIAWLLTGFSAGPFEAILDGWTGLTIMYGAVALCFARAALVREERGVAALLGGAILIWALGDTWFRLVLYDLEVIPIPSPADFGYLLFYPPAYAAIGLLLRSRVANIDRSVWFDGAIGGLAVAAVAAAVVFDAVLGTVGGSPIEIATSLIYPLADMVLLALVVTGIAISGWRLDRTWLWIGGGLVTFAAGDSLYLYSNATDAYQAGGILDSSWALAAIMIAWAAWQPAAGRREAAAAGRWRTIAMPIVLAIVALVVLVAGASSNLNLLATILAAACLVAVLGRLAITYGDNLDMLSESREEASTDALTGLGNRRKLMLDAEQMVGLTNEQPMLLALFDLNGFKQYNDTYGHPAGDALLARLGTNLQQAMADSASCYRMGGDEFCVLAPIEYEGADSILARATTALSEEGEGFVVSSAYGATLVPGEARGTSEALRLADQRMYAQKSGGRTSARRQSADVLLQALQESDPELGAHLGDVARLADATARELGMSSDEVDHVRAAGELHDVGKMAIPDAILNKPGPLDEVEWEFVRRHSIIGERIVAAAPALAGVAKLVRSVHEHWDGSGYPDSLAGEQIPLGARVVCVSDAFHAMTADRPYRQALSSDAASAELLRCAGSQFDPQVVDAFCRVQQLEPAAPWISPVPVDDLGRAGPVVVGESNGKGTSR
jgi:two-component system, cell cycle response regulator